MDQEQQIIDEAAVEAVRGVLEDPGSCVRVYGTREDYLIPSACLNSTVSGLISRTVLNHSIGPNDTMEPSFIVNSLLWMCHSISLIR